MARNLSTTVINVTGLSSDPASINNVANGSRMPLALITPATLSSASFTFQGSLNGVDWFNLFDEGTAYSVPVAVSRYIALRRNPFEAVPFIRIIPNVSEVAPRPVTIVTGLP